MFHSRDVCTFEDWYQTLSAPLASLYSAQELVENDFYSSKKKRGSGNSGFVASREIVLHEESSLAKNEFNL